MIYYAYILIAWSLANMTVAVFQDDLGTKTFSILKMLDTVAIMAAVLLFSFGG